MSQKLFLYTPSYCLLLISLLIIGCSSENDNKKETQSNHTPTKTTHSQFTLKNQAHTNIAFKNDIIENPNINFVNFEYIYNGGGVAIGDINNDGLQDLYFTATFAPNRLYLNKGNLQFEDITAKAGVVAANGIKTGVSMVDINNDGFLDIYVCRTGQLVDSLKTNLLYINNTDGTFTESAAKYGLIDNAYSNCANFFDYDLDGDLDMYLVNFPVDFQKGIKPRVKQTGGKYTPLTDPTDPAESDRFFENNGDGTFTDISRKAGIYNSTWGLSVSVADFNGDDYPDIYVANDYLEPDFVYINNKNGTFTDQFEHYFRHTSQHSMGSDIADFNNDGHPDIFVLDMIPEDNKRQKLLMTPMQLDRVNTFERMGYGGQQMRNMLQLNNGNGTFSEIGQLSGISHTDWSWGPLLVDFDNDGLKDLFIANGYRKDVTNLDFIKFKNDSLVNEKGGFKITDDASIMRIINSIPSEKIRNYMYQNKGDLKFKDVSNNWGFSTKTFSNGAAFADLDNDGDLDIVVNNIADPAMLYENNADKIGTNNYLRLKFEGQANNIQGIGTQATLWIGDQQQFQELRTARGFFSSVESTTHFGMGKATKADRLEIRWTDGKQQILENVTANQTLTIQYKDAQKAPKKSAPKTPIFKEATASLGIDFKHSENNFIDFKREPLIPHKLSQNGPGLAVADVTGDGLEDFYVGGAAGQAGALFVQNKNGKFTKTNASTWTPDKASEDMGALFFDADGDTDLDLYIVSGGNAQAANSPLYQDRLYTNDGKGNFTKATKALPQMYHSGACVAAADYDADGDLDLFVGGRTLPNSYPLSPRSYLLQNNGGTFTDVTATLAPDLATPGMVTGAVFVDLNGDQRAELALVGEWMPLTIFQFDQGIFSKMSTTANLGDTNGWWNTLTAADIDKDGDMDLIAGNLGYNSRFKVSAGQPACVYAKDFDNNGKLDAVMCHYIKGRSWPVAQRDILLGQIPSLRKKFPQYARYAEATIETIFTPEELKDAVKLEAKTFATTYFENQGDGRFTPKKLPIEAQISPTYGIVAEDIDGDGNMDLVIAGNNYHADVESGRYDAGNGLFLKGDDKGNFEPVHLTESGFFIPKDSRAVASLKLANGKRLILVANNDDKLVGFEVE